MRIGLDIDGVLADFVSGYQREIVAVTGRDLFEPEDIVDSPVWDWPELRGYTKEEMRKVWGTIINSLDFWTELGEDPGMAQLRPRYPDLVNAHDLYFITKRPGQDAKWQTEVWLATALNNPLPTPTVLIADSKGTAALALDLNVYLDDNFDNILDVHNRSPKTRAYLLDRSYNRSLGSLPPSITRVSSVEEMFQFEMM